jgi:hypothetical protein
MILELKLKGITISESSIHFDPAPILIVGYTAEPIDPENIVLPLSFLSLDPYLLLELDTLLIN